MAQSKESNTQQIQGLRDHIQDLVEYHDFLLAQILDCQKKLNKEMFVLRQDIVEASNEGPQPTKPPPPPNRWLQNDKGRSPLAVKKVHWKVFGIERLEKSPEDSFKIKQIKGIRRMEAKIEKDHKKISTDQYGEKKEQANIATLLSIGEDGKINQGYCAHKYVNKTQDDGSVPRVREEIKVRRSLSFRPVKSLYRMKIIKQELSLTNDCEKRQPYLKAIKMNVKIGNLHRSKIPAGVTGVAPNSKAVLTRTGYSSFKQRSNPKNFLKNKNFGLKTSRVIDPG